MPEQTQEQVKNPAAQPDPKVVAFLKDIDDVCNKHGLDLVAYSQLGVQKREKKESESVVATP